MRDRIAPYLKPLGKHRCDAQAETGDHDLNGLRPTSAELVPAAVLVPIVTHPEPTVLLTLRTAHLRAHAGQVSFPGGRAEDDDAGPVDTALREAAEEIGLDRDTPEVLGLLDSYQTGTNYLVTPVVALVPPQSKLALAEFEVASTFEVPLSFLFDPANHTIESRPWKGSLRYYYAFRFEGHLIWGATAGMLMNLYRRLHGLHAAGPEA
jgi:8-oxo-dGTP pyrophosphatase MutT (NUDIX family)